MPRTQNAPAPCRGDVARATPAGSAADARHEDAPLHPVRTRTRDVTQKDASDGPSLDLARIPAARASGDAAMRPVIERVEGQDAPVEEGRAPEEEASPDDRRAAAAAVREDAAERPTVGSGAIRLPDAPKEEDAPRLPDPEPVVVPEGGILVEPADAGPEMNRVIGDDASEILSGTAGDDVIDAALGHDIVLAGDGDDIIGGYRGHDTIDAGNGDDRILLDTGRDMVTGVEGRDVFHFHHVDSLAAPIHTSTITDFDPSEDRLRFDHYHLDREPGEDLADLVAAVEVDGAALLYAETVQRGLWAIAEFDCASAATLNAMIADETILG